MDKEKFFQKNNEKFLPLGFKRELDDPMFYYEYSLIPEEVVSENDLAEEDIPKLLFGDSGTNKGFCIYTGTHFIWLDCGTPEYAIEIAKNITAFEAV